MIYTYVCKCGHTQEQSYPIGKSQPSIDCKCGEQMTKQIHCPDFMFMGEGWTRHKG